jgi:hypothetical protein
MFYTVVIKFDSPLQFEVEKFGIMAKIHENARQLKLKPKLI